ncbi:MAG: hypothetical protein QOI76_2309, partial [Frankiales bacterium]|nr:hypothetical protein [Frankiales bacterium]
MFQHSLASRTLRRTRTAVTAAALALAAIGPVVGIASPALASGPTTFSNGTALTVADGQPPCGSGCTPGLASTYPSPITVSGMAGTLSDMTVTLTGVTHAYTSDFDVLLTGPGGQKFILASDAGNNGGSSNATVTFSDAASGAPSADAGWGSGVQSYKPFNYSGDPDVWPSPAPAGPYSNADNGPSGSLALNTTTFASVFNGTSPNGVWNLYVVDDGQGDLGSISGGWSMSLTTAASAAATLTTVSTSASPVSTGASLTLSAHVTQASDSTNVTAGTVTFSDGSTVLGAPVTVNGSGVASMTTSSLAEGTHTITAAYTGSASFGNSSGSVSQVVDHPTTQAGNTYCNSGPLTVNDGSVGSSTGATPYPSHIVISGASGGLSALTVNLIGVTAAFADDLDVELVGPLGQKFMLASDAGGGVAISGANVTFDDNAAGTLAAGTGGWASGAVKPVDYNTGTDVMPAPAPSGWSSAAPTGAATLTSVFGGSSANGTWSLYVADDSIDGSAGSISSGWCLGTASNTDPATTTVLTSSVNPTALGGSTTFSAHVTATSGGANVTVGTVTFRDGSTVIGSAQALSGTGTASVATSALTEGSHAITATYSGVGGSFNLSSATLTQTVNGVTTVSGSTFCNAGGITVNDPPGAGQIGAASPYASHIVVSGITGNLSNLTVAVKAVSHAAPDDMDILLVGPGGQALKLASDAGGLVAITNLNVTFDDAAASSLPDSTSWGSGVITAKPTDYNDGTDSFPAPAPVSYGSPAPAGSATLSSTFAGTSPNGTWNLYVVDDSLGQTGTIGSWCLTAGITASAAADTYTAGMNTALTVPGPGVLSNDSGFPAPTVSAYDAATTQGGIVSMVTNGGFTYIPPSSFTGDDTFTYTASNGSTSVGTVTIHVTHIPVVSGATLSRQQGTAANSSSIATVSDAETAAGSLVVTTGSSTGISLSGVTNTAGTVSGIVGATCAATLGAHPIAVHATDTDGFTGNGTLTVNVTPNTAPVLTYGSLAANSGGGTTGDSLTGPSDNGSVAALAIQSVTPAFTGTITVDGPATGTPGRIHVTNAGPSGTYTVTVRATDDCAQTTDVPVTLTVNGAPTVDAGSDDTTSLLAGPYILSGTASDDGLAPGTGLVTTWSQVSGPGTASFDDSHSLSAAATFDVGGVYVLQLSATDGQLTSTDTVQITVLSQPNITVPSDITVGESSPGAGANVPFTVTATGFPPPTVSCLDGTTAVVSGDHFAAGVHTIACLADNVAGSAGGSFTITVNSSPVITVPADITVNESSPGAGLAVTFSVTATGVPAASIACFEGSTSVTSGDTFAVGSHTISCTATNGSGTDTKTFHIIVRSVPVITVPASFSVLESPAGSGHAVVAFTVTATGFPTPTIGCLEGSTSVVSGDTFTAGVHTIDCTATNGAGTDTASFTVTVDTVPVITVPSDITVNESSPGAGR